MIYFIISAFIFLILQCDDSYCGPSKGVLMLAHLICSIFWPLFVLGIVIHICIDTLSDVPYNE